MSFKRLLYIQHGLIKAGGHWLRETLAFKDAAEAQGIEWFCLAHQRVPKDVALKAAGIPAFPFKPHDTISADENIAKLASYIELADIFAETLIRYLPADLSENDLMFLPFCTDIEMFAITRWLHYMPVGKRPKIALLFHHLNLSWEVDIANYHLNGDTSTWEYAARALKLHITPDMLRLYAINATIAKVLSSIIKMPTSVLSFTNGPVSLPVPAVSDKQYDVAILGGARAEQGTALWPGFFTELLRLRPDARIFLQAQKPEHKQELEVYFRKHAPGASVTIVAGQLICKDYDAPLVNSRLIVLPYMPDRYCLRESGVFCDATASGIPTAVSQGSSMANYIQTGEAAGTTFPYGNPVGIAQAVHAALSNIDALDAKARALAPAWSHKHDAHRLLERMLKDCA